MAKILFIFSLCLAVFGTVAFAASQCPEPNGKFPSSEQCDAYTECVNGVAEEKLCPDGLLFNPRNTSSGDCTYVPYSSCKDRVRLQPPQATEDCPRQFGFYRIGSDAECDQYKDCAHGIASITKCPEGLAFNKETYQCDWPDLVADCNAEAFIGFTCPPAPLENSSSVTGAEAAVDSDDGVLRYFRNPHNCRTYFVCVNGHPRLYNCGKFLAFNEKTGLCEFYTHVPECYKMLKDIRKHPQVQQANDFVHTDQA